MGVEVVVCWEFVGGRRRRLRTAWRGGRMSNVEGGGRGGRRVVEGASVGEFAEGISMFLAIQRQQRDHVPPNNDNLYGMYR